MISNRLLEVADDWPLPEMQDDPEPGEAPGTSSTGSSLQHLPDDRDQVPPLEEETVIEYRQVIMAANGTAELFSIDATTGFASKLRTAPSNGVYQLRIVATTVGVQMRVSSGPEMIIPTSPVGGGGTIGVFPAQTDSEPLQWDALQGDEQSCELLETLAGTPSVMAIIEFLPAA